MSTVYRKLGPRSGGAPIVRVVHTAPDGSVRISQSQWPTKREARDYAQAQIRREGVTNVSLNLAVELWRK